jgi:hypothetical protein
VVVNRCWLCESDEESVDHLLLHCGAARALWNAFFVRFGLCWVMPRSVMELLASWWSSGCSRSAVIWKMVPLCIMWCIWSERNLRCFEDSSRSIEDLLHFFMFTLFSWTAGWLAPRVLSFSEFLSLFPFPLAPLYTPCLLRVAPLLRFFLYISDLSKKKRKVLLSPNGSMSLTSLKRLG